MAKVELQNVTKIYDKTIKALDDVSFTVKDGEFFVLLGPTGAGKTTMLRSVAGLEKIDKGKILFDDEDITSAQPAARDTAFVFQQYSLYPHYKVYDNLAFPLRSPLRKLPESEIDSKVTKIAEMLKISPKLNNKATELSGGEMQRVAIGRALVRDPNIYLMDEPLSSLDAKLRESLRVELKKIQLNLGATILYVTHDQAEATTMADEIGVLENGKIAQIGTPEEIYNKPNSIYVANRLGSPKINILNNSTLKTSLPSSDHQLGVRPEHVKLGQGELIGSVKTIEALGAETVVELDYNGTEILSLYQGSFDGQRGQDIKFGIDNSKVLFFNEQGMRV
jgi:multiple sugar transport system ATP-binding protein|tara:strand:+ start:2716 stop:3723 length:1008 start_codon:yes stop_codon:yes gene_type:complete